MQRALLVTGAASLLLLLAGCSGNDKKTDHEAEAILAVKDFVDVELDGFVASTIALQNAAPAPDADGWGAGETAAMKTAWAEARAHYERVEGAIAVLFPELDASTDER